MITIRLRYPTRLASRRAIRAWIFAIRAVCLAAACTWCSTAAAQRAQSGAIHYFHSANLPPGTVAQGQLLRGGPLRGYFQPVEIQVPEGTQVSLNANGQFGESRDGPVLVGMQIGPVYQFKVTGIPFQEGAEVFPTIEIVNRLFPPPGQKRRFPVPIQLTQEELEMALSGRYVTRVVYLEDPATALPRREDPQSQRYFEASPGQDPLRVADQLGRPMAILRMGSRVPDLSAPGPSSAYGTPPLILYSDPPQADSSQAHVRSDSPAIERRRQHVPRLPETPAVRDLYPVGSSTRP